MFKIYSAKPISLQNPYWYVKGPRDIGGVHQNPTEEKGGANRPSKRQGKIPWPSGETCAGITGKSTGIRSGFPVQNRFKKNPGISKNSPEFFSSLGIGEVTDLDKLKCGRVIAGHQTHDDEKNVSIFFEPLFRFYRTLRRNQHGRFRTKNNRKDSGSRTREPDCRRGGVQHDRPVGHRRQPVCLCSL